MADTLNTSVEKIVEISKRSRKRILDMALAAGASSAHLGGALSYVEVAATLFGTIMRHDSKNPEWADRDRFILSKGHGCLGYYAILSEMGYLTNEELLTFEKSGSILLGHPVMNRPKGIEYSTGSLGMGLALGIGVAIASKRRNSPSRVYVVMGDGECNEGSVWEGLLSAAHFKLDNLTVIIDRNKLQQTGSNQDIMCIGNVAEKLNAFGWQTTELDGHNAEELYRSLSSPVTEGKPRAIVAHTVKGKGFSFSENNNAWHHNVLTQSQYDKAIEELYQ